MAVIKRNRIQPGHKPHHLLLCLRIVVISLIVLVSTYNILNLMFLPNNIESSSRLDVSGKTSKTDLVRAGPIQIKEAEVSPKSQVMHEFAALALSNEPAFLAATSHSCMSKKCLSNIPRGSNVKRIAILVPPGMIGHYFFSLIKDVVQLADPTAFDRMLIFESTHVPPYGYGENHGITKIVQLQSTWLRVAVSDAIYSTKNNANFETDDDLTRPSEKENVSVLRQLVRWHCRLSHVSAHTSLLTVPVRDVITNLTGSISKILKFIDEDLVAPIQQFGGNSSEYEENVRAILKLKASSVKVFENSVMEVKEKSVAALLFSSAFQMGGGEDPLDAALGDELKMSNNLKDWPCKSFWDVENSTREGSTPFLLGEKLLPDCINSFVKCSIRKDQCELQKKLSCE